MRETNLYFEWRGLDSAILPYMILETDWEVVLHKLLEFCLARNLKRHSLLEIMDFSI